MARVGAAIRIPDDERIYVVGDIHGRLDLLHDLNQQIAAEVAGTPQLRATTVFLGDYVGRGPNSAGVLEMLSSGAFATQIIALRGNHEEVMLRFLADENVLDSWRKFGGLETLHSYGIAVSAAMRGDKYDEARSRLLQSIPQTHLDFLEGTQTSFSVGDYFFAMPG